MIGGKPKLLLLDYETSPASARFFGPVWEPVIMEVTGYEQIISVAWKFYGDKKVNVISQNDFKGYKAGILDDRKLVEFFAPIINSAERIIAHNGDDFDVKVFNTRLVAHHLNPISVDKTFDTKKITKNKFHFPSNKLDDIADFLQKNGYDIPRKLPHTGKHMWLGCEKGNKADWDLMKKYNRQDVVILDKVFEIVSPFMKQVNDYIIDINCPNPTCLSKNMVKSKKRPVKGGFKYQYQCKDCGSYLTDSKKYNPT